VGIALLAEVYPEWRSYRSAFARFGLGVAIVPLVAAVHPMLSGALAIALVVGIAASPGPAGQTPMNPVSSAPGITYPELVRLQRIVSETRHTLEHAFPHLPAHASIARHEMPRLALYAFGGDEALQTWYRDSTLHWISFGDFLANRGAPPLTLVEYQPHGEPLVALVDPAAMRLVVAAADSLRRE